MSCISACFASASYDASNMLLFLMLLLILLLPVMLLLILLLLILLLLLIICFLLLLLIMLLILLHLLPHMLLLIAQLMLLLLLLLSHLVQTIYHFYSCWWFSELLSKMKSPRSALRHIDSGWFLMLRHTEPIWDTSRQAETKISCLPIIWLLLSMILHQLLCLLFLLHMMPLCCFYFRCCFQFCYCLYCCCCNFYC